MTTRMLSCAGALVSAVILSACGSPPPPPPDAGVDTSCGIDCAAQQKYGLILKRCFEYTDTNEAQAFPALGVYVREVRQLEGGVPVISVDYLQGGARKMTDSFILRDGSLVLARREFTSGGSVTYKDDAGNIVGVDWWHPDTTSGQNFETDSSADVVLASGTRQTDATSFKVITSDPLANEKAVPAGNFDTAVKLVFNEQPPHGMDGRRVFVDGTGFTLLSSGFSQSSTDIKPYRLQDIRDIGSPDAGSGECSLGR